MLRDYFWGLKLHEAPAESDGRMPSNVTHLFFLDLSDSARLFLIESAQCVNLGATHLFLSCGSY